MINEENILNELENDEIHRLLGGLRRVECPKDFDFRVKARIAKGRPAETRRLWSPVRVAVPLLLLLTFGTFVGYRVLNQAPAINSVAGVPQVEAPAGPNAFAPQVETPQPSSTATAVTPPDIASADTPEKLNVKPIVKTAPTAKTEKPGGGSYDTAAGTGANIISKKDEDDLAPEPQVRRVLISTREFLTNSGISATYPGAGGRITSVGGAASAAGVIAGDVIESVSVQSGSIRVTRDGKSLTFRIK